MLADKDKHKKSRRTAEICSIEDLLPQQHIVRAIDASVDWLRVFEAAEPLYSAEVGRPGVDPVVLVKIALIQHVFRHRSLRQTVAEIEINIAYRWFIGCSLLERVPHFSTVSANFVRRINGELFDKIFADVIEEVMSGCDFAPADIIYESPYLKRGGGYDRLAKKYLSEDVSQMTFDSPQTPAGADTSVPTAQRRGSDITNAADDDAQNADIVFDSEQISFATDDDLS
jgi:Transposase and inactivated derivatives